MGLDTAGSIAETGACRPTPIPAAITTLVSLVDLHLDNNALVGHIPRTSVPSRCGTCTLQPTAGTLPASLGMLAELEFFGAEQPALGVVPDAMRAAGACRSFTCTTTRFSVWTTQWRCCTTPSVTTSSSVSCLSAPPDGRRCLYVCAFSTRTAAEGC